MKGKSAVKIIVMHCYQNFVELRSAYFVSWKYISTENESFEVLVLSVHIWATLILNFVFMQLKLYCWLLMLNQKCKILNLNSNKQFFEDIGIKLYAQCNVCKLSPKIIQVLRFWFCLVNLYVSYILLWSNLINFFIGYTVALGNNRCQNSRRYFVI